MCSNAELREQTKFWKFSSKFLFVVLDEKYMALTATFSHSNLIVFLSHNIMGLYFKQIKEQTFLGCK